MNILSLFYTVQSLKQQLYPESENIFLSIQI